ncbi:30S ribosomal protein S16 [Janibacter sp. YIM B02568]|uniref:30S ribosomal protein S16 n=1 Tax=Janibacter endophyticus TaxID=2806261 RepID=UPI0019509C8B|nr:30S ribosomal protein S16 [Janibacter endophyticus]MBM6545916.1 30S ribosomal protein S16 [Janibacter endophyticus]
MAVKIRLKRMGKIRAPFYRVVVMDSRTKRDGRAIEEIGKYHPTEEPSVIEIDMDRARYWISNGAQPTEAVARLLEILESGNLKVKEPKTPKKDLYEAALAASGKEEHDHKAITAKKKAEKKAADEAAAAEKAAEEAKAAEAAAEEAPAEAAAETEAAAEAPAEDKA